MEACFKRSLYIHTTGALNLALDSLIWDMFSLYFIGLLWDFLGETMGLWIFILEEENKSMNAHVSSVYVRMQRIVFRDMKSL